LKSGQGCPGNPPDKASEGGGGSLKKGNPKTISAHRSIFFKQSIPKWLNKLLYY
jgi:hypothetical protein